MGRVLVGAIQVPECSECGLMVSDEDYWGYWGEQKAEARRLEIGVVANDEIEVSSVCADKVSGHKTTHRRMKKDRRNKA